jgi:uncharacterized repeat protein (TIGR02543 family)
MRYLRFLSGISCLLLSNLLVAQTTVNVSTSTELTNAIVAASSSSSPTTIVLAAGTYNLTSDLPALAANNLAIRGPVYGSSAVINATALTSGVIFNIAADQVTIANLTLQNARSHAITIQPGADSGRIEECTFANPTSPLPATAAIDGNGCAGWTVTGNSISGIAGSTTTAEPAIHFYGGASDSTITNNLILNCDRAIGFGGDPTPIAPTITNQPIDITVAVGQTATFTVSTAGTPAPTFQWYKNGGAISGATSASYTTPATTTADNGTVFSVVITNSAGSITSSTVTLTVSATPVVSYNANGATSGNVPSPPVSHLAGETVTVQGNTGTLARTGYNFIGWNTAADGSGTTYFVQDTFTMGASSVTLYARWRSIVVIHAADVIPTRPAAMSATFRCVRAGATGTGTGLDWENAYPALPAKLTRGTTYYIADGTYAGQDFDASENGQWIWILKATSQYHGTDIGWDASYGGGQAIFNSAAPAGGAIFVFKTGYYVVDGVVGGGPANWTSGHGFVLTSTTGLVAIDFRGPSWWNPPMPTHIVIAHLEHNANHVKGSAGIKSSTQTQPDAVYMDLPGTSHIWIHHCYLHDYGGVDFATMPMNTFAVSYWLFENNEIARNTSTTAYHSEAWQDNGSSHMIIRNNWFEDIEGTQVIALKTNHYVRFDDWQVYGNIMYTTAGAAADVNVGMGVFGLVLSYPNTDPRRAMFPCNDCVFYNNTIIRLAGVNSGVLFVIGERNYAYNNIWYNCLRDGSTQNTFFQGTVLVHDYNTFINSLKSGQTLSAHETTDTQNIFTSVDTRDVTLVAPTAPGTPLDSDCALDMLGHLRGADGTFDRGALEFINP